MNRAHDFVIGRRLLIEFDAEIEEEEFKDVFAVVFIEVLGFLLQEGLVLVYDGGDGRWGEQGFVS